MDPVLSVCTRDGAQTYLHQSFIERLKTVNELCRQRVSIIKLQPEIKRQFIIYSVVVNLNKNPF